MTDWYKNVASAIQPELDASSSADTVYQRKNFVRLPDDFIGGKAIPFWQFDERTMSHDEYAQLRISELESENTNLQLALTELYEKLLEG